MHVPCNGERNVSNISCSSALCRCPCPPETTDPLSNPDFCDVPWPSSHPIVITGGSPSFDWTWAVKRRMVWDRPERHWRERAVLLLLEIVGAVRHGGDHSAGDGIQHTAETSYFWWDVEQAEVRAQIIDALRHICNRLTMLLQHVKSRRWTSVLFQMPATSGRWPESGATGAGLNTRANDSFK